VVGGFALLIWIVRPRPAVGPLQLIGSDVDGLVMIELNRSSVRVNRFLEPLIRPISYEVQSRPEDLARELFDLLDVMTFRCAMGLLRYDPVADREHWALVVPLKRMADPLKVAVKQVVARETTAKVETETSGGALLFWGKPEMPCFAIEQRALVVAGDRQWLGEILRRVGNPLARTSRATDLYSGLPEGGKHCLARACILTPPKRWEHWAGPSRSSSPLGQPVARVHRFLEECGLGPTDIQTLCIAAVVQPRGRMQFDLRISCGDTSALPALARRVKEKRPSLSLLLQGRDVAEVIEPTTTSAGLSFGWRMPPLEQVLDLGASDLPATSSPK